jgi:lysophospholipase L1-like esterase
MVAEPCPPFPEAAARFLAAPGETVPPKEALKAYADYGAYVRANDWPGLCRYRDEDRKALLGPRPRAVFMGDSITENWRRYDAAFFAEGVLDRGVSGQTSPQMLACFYQDVIALRPRVVHIMAGTNDVAGNTGPTSEVDFKNNIRAMVDLARANGVAVVLASIPPTQRFPWRPELKPAPEIVALNRWLAAFAHERGLVFADYASVLATPEGGLRPELTRDGVHLNKAGYALIEPLAQSAITAAEGAGAG